MEGFDRIRNACCADLKFNEGDLEVSVKSTVFPEIVMLPCRVNNRIKGLFYVLSFVVELNRRLPRLKLVWKASGLGLAYTFARLSFVPRNTQIGQKFVLFFFFLHASPACPNPKVCLHLCPAGKSAPGAASE